MVVYMYYLLVVFLARTTAYHLCGLKDSRHLPGNGAIPIRVFALDFDGTATTLESKDFLQFIYQAILQNSEKTTRKIVGETWYDFTNGKLHSIVTESLKRLQNSPNRITPGKTLILRETLAEMDNMIQHFLKSNEVQNYVLKGITVKGIKEIAMSKPKLCPGLVETLQRFRKNSINIISAGQSKIYEEFVFRKYNAPRNLIFHSGELVFKNGVSTGEIVGRLTTFDKEKVMAHLIKQYRNISGYSVYVGNDFVDLLAMLKADIGIAINYTPLFIRFVHTIGITTQPVNEWRGACSNKEYLIYTAQSWYEIEEMLFGRLQTRGKN